MTKAPIFHRQVGTLTAHRRVSKFVYLGWTSTRLSEQPLIDWQTNDMTTSNPNGVTNIQSKPQQRIGLSTTVGWCLRSNVLQIVSAQTRHQNTTRRSEPTDHPYTNMPNMPIPRAFMCWNMIHCLQQVLDQNFGITFLGRQKQSEMEGISRKLV